MTSRPDVINYYISGSRVETDWLMTNVVILSNSTVLRNYEFQHSQDEISLLTSIQLFDPNTENSYYNKTIFKYDESNNILTGEQSEFNNNYRYYYGDFNGDGLTDYTRIPVSLNSENNLWEMFINESEGIYNFVSSGEISTYVIEGHANEQIAGKTHGKYSLDFNGDGLGDMVWKEIVEEPLVGEMYQFSIMYSTGTGFHPYSGSATYYCGTDDSYYVLDVDGNGTDDFLSFNQETNEYKIGFYSAGIYNEKTGSLPYSLSFSVATTGDFNNNGKQEVLIYWENHIASLEFNNINSALELKLYSNSIDFTSDNHQFFTGDFNGDNNYDLLTYSGQWNLFISTGNGFTLNSEFNSNFINYNPENNDYIIVGDFNGDGNSDVAEFNNYSEYFTDIKLNYSNGYSFYTEEINGFGEVFSYPANNIGDFNGDGNMDIMDYSNNSKESLFFHSFERPSLMVSVEDGFGSKTEISYLPLTNKSIYNKGEDAEYPIVDLQTPFYVVESINPDSEFGIGLETVYKYSGARVHKQGKGFLGFQQIQVTDKLLNTITESNYGLYMETITGKELYYVSFPETVRLFSMDKGIQDKKLSETNTKMSILRTMEYWSDLVYYPVTTSSLSHNWDNDSDHTFIKTTKTIQSISDIDDYGNSVKSKTATDKREFTDIIQIEDYQFVTTLRNDYSESIDIENWLISRPTSITVRLHDEENSSNDYISQVEYKYYNNTSDAGYSLPKSINKMTVPIDQTEVAYYHSFDMISEIEYDHYGHIIKEIKSAPFSESKLEDIVTEYRYDLSDQFNTGYGHRFLTKIITETPGDDYVEQFVYDPVTGLVEMEISPSGLITYHEYGTFNRLEKTIFPDDTYVENSLEWTGQNGGQLYYSQAIDQNQALTKTYYDKFGREQMKIFPNHDKQMHYLSKYDERGRLAYVSTPRISWDGASKWTFYDYDDDGKLRKKSNPNGTILFYDYKGSTTIVTNNYTGITTSKTTNVLGRPIEVIDPTGSVKYSYFSSGKLKSVEANNSTTYMDYDPAGYQKMLDEPNVGVNKYTYDAYGRLISQVDGKGNHYVMEYDILGRIIRKELKSGSDWTNYEYNDNKNVNGFGELLLMANNSIVYSYEYDHLGRLDNQMESFLGNNYISRYSYNDDGLVDTYIYPSGYSVAYEYYLDGSLSIVKDAESEKKLWELTSLNDLGQIGSFTLGNGLSTNKLHNEYGLLKEIVTAGVQDLEYNFNTNTGNLNWRKDHVFGLEETFTYDKLLQSRLESWQVSGLEKYEIQYKNNGNIFTKTDLTYHNYPLSVFLYGNNAGSNALTSIVNPQTSYLDQASKQDIEYTAFNKTMRIDQSVSGLNQKEGLTYGIEYGPDQARKISVLYKNYKLVKQKHYIGNYEVEFDALGNRRELNYISGGDGLFAIYVNNMGADTMYYIQKDHLDSPYCITGEDGRIIELKDREAQIYSFDPWGRRRHPQRWDFVSVPTSHLFDRGFTGHEHLDDFALINMNGRTYDPWIGRMLQPDNYVQAAGYLQNYNRYSYALNNPLKYTDPSGENWVAFGIGAIVGGVQGYVQGSAQGYTGSVLLGSIAQGMLHGAITSGLGSMSGRATASSMFGMPATGAIEGIILGSVSGALTGGFSGGLSSAATGGSFWQGAKYGAIYGSIGGGISGGNSAYMYAKSKGVNPWTGGSLQDKLNSVVAKYSAVLSEGYFGDEGIQDVLVGSNENLSKYKTKFVETEAGLMKSNSSGKTARGYTQPITKSSRYTSKYEDISSIQSRIFIAKQVVREAFHFGSLQSIGTFVHEYSHSYDYWSGSSDYFYKLNYNNNIAMEAWGEYRAYSRAYNFTGSNRDFKKMNQYAAKLSIYF